MSGTLVSAVFKSGLTAWLKPFAAVYASYAKDDGTQCWPAIKTVAADLGRKARQTQTATAELRRRGILRIVEAHSPYRSTRYKFIIEALPPRAMPDQLALSFEHARFPQPKPAKCSGNARFPQLPQALTGNTLRERRNTLHPIHHDPSLSTRTRAREHAKAYARGGR